VHAMYLEHKSCEGGDHRSLKDITLQILRAVMALYSIFLLKGYSVKS
jgi:hypothetical protein